MPGSNSLAMVVAVIALALAGFATYCGKYNYDAGRELTEWTKVAQKYESHIVKDTCHGESTGCPPSDHVPPPPPPPEW
jgi:hypothetical protein